jgi:TetR/AcrR family fatty acid metabolism transcriptional regulator
MSPRTPQENERLREERRIQILETAIQFFAEQGYYNTKMSDIAQRLGLAKGTIYWYFDSKEDLFNRAFRHEFEKLAQPLLERALRQDLDAGEKLLAIAQASLDLLSNFEDLVFIMFQSMTTPQLGEMLTHDFKEYYDQFAQIIIPLFEQIGEPDPAGAASLFFAVLDGLMLQSLIQANLFDKERALAQIKLKFNL